MGKIALLPDILCNQIAAGEVVERPAAVVKELMENCIDAHAGTISIRLLEAGRKEICVVDNGEGMSSDDALLAIERHATSKVRVAADLDRIQSLGFRGEALPSIAAVSRFAMVTRERQATAGTRVYIEGGVLRDVREAGCPAGTQIVVRDLFFSVPARRKFLRSRDTEMAHISDQFLRLAMAHPDIHWQLYHQGRLCYDLAHMTSHEERARRILGMELAETLRPFASDHPALRLHGLLGPPELHRASSQHLFVYVNGRPIWDRLVHRAILAAYDTLVPKGKFPVVILFLEMGPQLVDVNVHPTKREVRWREPGSVVEAVRATVSAALEELQQQRWYRPLAGGREMLAPAPGQSLREQEVVLTRPASAPPPAASAGDGGEGRQAGFAASAPPSGRSSLASLPATAGAPQDEPRFAGLPVCGQLAHSYILLEAPDGLVIIDQHAAHERIVFERLSRGLTAAREPRQRLTQAQVLEFLPKEAAILRRWLPGLTDLGFEIEPFGGDSFVVHAIPAAVHDQQPAQLLRELVEAAQEGEALPGRLSLLANLAKSAACRRAVKARHKLSLQEILELLRELDETLVSATCPHGRPLWWKLTHAEIARFFQRSQPPGSLKDQ
jgi:DNA mismatch repair protein MutL